MANFALLNNVDHQDVKIVTERAARYGDGVMKAPVFPFEFRDVQAFYPILFQDDGEGGRAPVALFGFQEGENLFLSDSGWEASYIPAMVRRAPFLIGFQETNVGGKKERLRVLSLDMDHPRVNTNAGEALFQPLGGRTPFLEQTADLLEAIHDGLDHGAAFTRALRQHDLLEPVTFEVTLEDGGKHSLFGFDCVNEDKAQTLSGAVLDEFNKAGFLMPLFMVLASLGNISRLVERKNQRAARAADGSL